MALTTRKANLFDNPSKATRQQIPPFLSKLFAMVNDSKTDPWIRWSDDGDSFYVYDHERFAKEVLPHWFKHNNFGSFVRQLNNYGFHKVPHLQQGVLKSDGEAEVSHFENQYFHRGQPDLLCLIQRKKQLQTDGDENVDIKEPLISIQSNGADSDSTHHIHNTRGQVLDINAVVNGIQAIKRHQHAISAELKELHQSNQSLWQEAFAARERHKKHHDTITRILKFLAGVFGQSINSSSPRTQEVPHDNSPGRNPSSTAVVLRGNRLMIENGNKSESNESEKDAASLNISELMEPLDFEGGQANDGVDRFTTIGTPTPSIASPITVATTPKQNGKVLPAEPEIHSTASSSIPPVNKYSFPATNHNRLSTTNIPSLYMPNVSSAENTNTTALASNASLPADINSTFAAILNNPIQLNRVLAALSPGPIQMPPAGDATVDTANLGDLRPPSPSLFGSFRLPEGQLSPIATLSSLNGSNGIGPLSLSPTNDDTSTLHSLAQSTSQLQKSYKGAVEVEADVNLLHGQIESLIESLGLDSQTTASLRGAGAGTGAEDEIVASSSSSAGPSLSSSIPITTTQLPDAGSSDFDFDSFFSFDPHGTSNTAGFSPVLQQSGAEGIGAFLDEVQSVSNESDVANETVSVSTGVGDQTHENTTQGNGDAERSKKRKSDAVELGEDKKPRKASRTDKKG